MLRLSGTIVWCCRLRQVAIVLGKWRQWTEKNKDRDRAQLEIPQTVTVLQ